jgi:hypothetical protein
MFTVLVGNPEREIILYLGEYGKVIFLSSCPPTRELARILEHRADYSVS